MRISGFPFKAGGRTFRLVVYQAMSGTLMPFCMCPFLFLFVCLFFFTFVTEYLPANPREDIGVSI